MIQKSHILILPLLLDDPVVVSRFLLVPVPQCPSWMPRGMLPILWPLGVLPLVWCPCSPVVATPALCVPYVLGGLPVQCVVFVLCALPVQCVPFVLCAPLVVYLFHLFLAFLCYRVMVNLIQMMMSCVAYPFWLIGFCPVVGC